MQCKHNDGGETAWWVGIKLFTNPSVLQELVAVVFLSEKIVEDVVVSLAGGVPQ